MTNFIQKGTASPITFPGKRRQSRVVRLSRSDYFTVTIIVVNTPLGVRQKMVQMPLPTAIILPVDVT